MWIGLAVVAVLAIIFFVYINQRATVLSPPGEESLTSGGITVTVKYGRPSARGRLIFGAEDQKALQPYGKYWRLGANAATEIKSSAVVNVPLMLGAMNARWPASFP